MFATFALLEKESVWQIGTNVTLCGLVIVFLALILLVLVISAFSAIFDRKKPMKPAAASQPIQKAPPAAVSAPVQNTEEAEEIIAVIAAAVDAMYSGSGKKAVIRSVRPAVASGRSVWAAAGISKNTRAF